MRGRHVVLIAVAIALFGAWSASLASAKKHHKPLIAYYKVEYGGKGTLSSREVVPVACGNVDRVENSDFSWHVTYHMKLTFSRNGVDGDKVEEQPSSLGNDEKATVSFIGCGSTATCDGRDAPNNKKATLFVGAVRPGLAITFRVGAVNLPDGYWSGHDFTGASSLPTAPGESCAKFLDNDVGFGVLLFPEASTIAEQVRAEFKVPYAKLKGLKADDFFETKIAPGSHAPEHHDVCFADDGCTSETFQWKGAVSILRES
jgi:hypothetical protein